MDVISSSANSRIKWLKQLMEKSAIRKSSGCFVVEGIKEIKLALDNHFELINLYGDPQTRAQITSWSVPAELFVQVQQQVLNKLVYREGASAMLAVFRSREWALTDFNDEPLIIVLDGLEKPGNIGAISRTIAALGVPALMVTNPVADVYNPHAIRSSVGGLFALKIGTANAPDLINWANKNGFIIFLAHVQGLIPPWQNTFPAKSLLVLGSEAQGLDAVWEQTPAQRLKIPMTGQMDSLNVANTAAMCIYEWVRQQAQKR